MIANEPTRRTSVAYSETLSFLLDKAREFARNYIETAEQRPVFPSDASLEALNALDTPLPENSSDPLAVLQQLHEIGSNAAVNQTAGRYFGFVNGGILPVGLASRWLADVWEDRKSTRLNSS